MPYLGPRTFATAPLTITNLAYLNNRLADSSDAETTDASTLTSLTPQSMDSSTSSYEDHTDIDDNKTIRMASPVNGSTSSVCTIVKDEPQHPLVRKKSGELVKSSLKLPDLKRSSSMPSAKSVRFASVLEKVKFFEKAERPIAVSTENSPVSSPTGHRPTWEFDVSSDSDSDSGATLDRWEIVHNDVPSTSGFNFAKFSGGRTIILESLRLGSNKCSLIGFVYVKNLAFEKKLSINLTLDAWKTSQIITNTNYISSNHIFNYSENESYDKFSFIIKFSELRNARDSIDMEFCIRYDVAGETFWDNNRWKNYRVIVHKSKQKAQELDYFHLVQTKYPQKEDDDDEQDEYEQDVCEFAPKYKPKQDVFKSRYNFDPLSNYNIDDSYFSPPKPAPLKRTTLGVAYSKPGLAMPQRRTYSHHYKLKKNNSAPSLVELSNSISRMDMEESRSPSNLQESFRSFSNLQQKSSAVEKKEPLSIKDSLTSRRNYDQFLQAYCFYGSPAESKEASPSNSPKFSQVQPDPIAYQSPSFMSASSPDPPREIILH